MKEIILEQDEKYTIYGVGECIDKNKKHEHIQRRACLDMMNGDKIVGNKMVSYNICTLTKGKTFKNESEAKKYAKEKEIYII